MDATAKHNQKVKILILLIVVGLLLFGSYLFYYNQRNNNSNNSNLNSDGNVEITKTIPVVERYPFVNNVGVKTYIAGSKGATPQAEVWGYIKLATPDRIVLSYKDSFSEISMETADGFLYIPSSSETTPVSWSTKEGLAQGLNEFKGTNVKIMADVIDDTLYAKNVRLSPEGLLQTKYNDYSSFPEMYRPYLKLADKENGMDFSNFGFYYFDDSSTLIITGQLLDWGETTVRMQLADKKTVDLVLPVSGITEEIENGEIALVTEERKIYHINRKVGMELELVEGNLVAKNILPLILE